MRLAKVAAIQSQVHRHATGFVAFGQKRSKKEVAHDGATLLTLRIYQKILRLHAMLYLFPMEFRRSSNPRAPDRISGRVSDRTLIISAIVMVILSLNTAFQCLSTLHLYMHLETLNMQRLFHVQISLFMGIGLATALTAFVYREEMGLLLNLFVDIGIYFSMDERPYQSKKPLLWYESQWAIAACVSGTMVCSNLLSIQIATAWYFSDESSFYWVLVNRLFPEQIPEAAKVIFMGFEAVKLTVTMLLVFSNGILIVIPYVALKVLLKHTIRCMEETQDGETVRSLYGLIEQVATLNNIIFGPFFQPCVLMFFTINCTFLLYMILQDSMPMNVFLFLFMVQGAIFESSLATLSYLQLADVKTLSESVVHGVKTLDTCQPRGFGQVTSHKLRMWRRAYFRVFGIKVGSYGYYDPGVVITWYDTLFSNLLLLLK